MLTHQQINHDYLFAYQKPEISALLKQTPEDFIVQESLSFKPDGQGSHAFLWVKKTSLNTHDVIQQLAEFTGLASKHIGYAGLKDKHAITYQWFSINLQDINEPDWNTFAHPLIEIMSVTYHQKKLKTGSISANSFGIILKDISPCDHKAIESRIEQVLQYGVPNYFGPQRFGTNNKNISTADAWFSGQRKIKQRSQKSIILSAARSFLFNHLLSKRIENFGWNNLLKGEVMILDGSNSIFVNDAIDNDIISRIKAKDIHPTLSLWGKGELLSQSDLASLEKTVADDYPNWCQALENKGLKQQRRALRIFPQQLKLNWLEQDKLQLQFSLSKGSYATTVLREIVGLL